MAAIARPQNRGRDRHTGVGRRLFAPIYVEEHTGTGQNGGVESQVTAVCRSHFRLPESPRSIVDHDDAGEWVKATDNIGRYRVLMVDLYDATAQGPVRGSLPFYQDCARALTEHGVITVNLFGEHASFEPNLNALREAFPDGLVVLPEIDAGNRIALGVKGDLLDVSVGDFIDRARDIEQRFRLPASRWARDILLLLQQAQAKG